MQVGLSPLQAGGDFEETIRECERGLTHLVCRMSVAGIPRDAAMASLDLFTRDVLPGLRRPTSWGA